MLRYSTRPPISTVISTALRRRNFCRHASGAPSSRICPRDHYLRRHDEAIRRVMDAVEMPDRVAENLILFIRQNNGTLSSQNIGQSAHFLGKFGPP